MTLGPVRPGATPLAYSALLYLLVLARLWWVRDADGNWSWVVLRQRLAAASGEGLGALFAAQDRSWASVLEGLRGFLLACGIGLVVLVPPLAQLAREVLSAFGLGVTAADIASMAESLGFSGAALVMLAIISWLLQKSQRRTKETESFKQAAAALRTARDLPFVLDLFNGPSKGLNVPAELQVLMDTLARWRPRTLDSEAAYEASLKRFLQKALPGAKVVRQQPLETAEGRPVGRLDIVVDDVLAVELKRLLRSTEADRAIGQVWKYAEAWTRGPILLLLCETRASFADAPFLTRIQGLRERGHPLFVVAAGRRIAA